MSRADAAARALADRFHLDTVPIDVSKVAESLDLFVVRQPADPDVNGILISRSDQDAIGLNDSQPLEGQRFAMAHMIGHHQIHRRRELILDVTNRYRLGNLPSTPTDREEAEANRFAAALLAPEPIVRRMAADVDFQTARQLVEMLAHRFEVSHSVMSYRLMALGIVMDH